MIIFLKYDRMINTDNITRSYRNSSSNIICFNDGHSVSLVDGEYEQIVEAIKKDGQATYVDLR